LLFHFKILIDILAIDPQLSRAPAIATGRTDESAGFSASMWLFF
jgi:hypothetical protein